MRILVTGNQGYVGPVVVQHLRKVFPEAIIEGYDCGWFAHSLTGAASWPEIDLNRQHIGDTRSIDQSTLNGVDAVVHLAAVSNDPIGNKFEDVTREINQNASVELAKKARDAGVRHFVFASSCSVYGFAAGAPRIETDELNPQTAYAKSKVASEHAFAQTDLAPMVVTSLRFATACGWSDRLRLDLVLNDFVASALATGTISVLSDGSPWRPLIDVRDMARAVEWACTRDPVLGGPNLSVNTGADEANYQVRDLAEQVAALIPGTDVSINNKAQPDTRSYRVSFSLFRQLAPDFTPKTALSQSIAMLRDGLAGMGFKDQDFRQSPYMRLRVLEDHMHAGRLDERLRWCRARAITY